MQKYPKCVTDAIDMMAKVDEDYKFIGVLVKPFHKVTFYTVLWKENIFSKKLVKTKEFKVDEHGQQMPFLLGEKFREDTVDIDELRAIIDIYDADKEIA